MREASRGFEGGAESVPQARQFAREVLARWQLGDAEWVLVQLLSELATNAVIHARTRYIVAIAHDDTSMRLSVRDTSPRTVVPRQYGADSTTGRGLQLVAQMSRAWGVDVFPDGKSVWVEIDPSSTPGAVGLDVDELLSAFDDDGLPDLPAHPGHRGRAHHSNLWIRCDPAA